MPLPDEVLKVDALTTYSVADDGSRFRLNVRDVDGRTTGVELPFDSLRVLMMTLPRIQRTALIERSGQPGLRIAYPLGNWSLERSDDGGLLLTIATEDGFEVCFRLATADADELAAALFEGAGLPAASGRTVN
ncbi:MAG TPA: hypothetical protein PKA20_18120 [Burkholderiaceae bacterium]|nr:hypothetical protein [Burkholderiaceae bacterium]